MDANKHAVTLIQRTIVWILLLLPILTFVPAAQADRIPEPTETMMVPPMGSIPDPAGPPPGDGDTPRPVVAGDQGQPDTPPTGQSDPTKGNIAGERQAKGTRPPSIYGDSNRILRNERGGQAQAVRNRLGPAQNYGEDENASQALNDPRTYPYVAAVEGAGANRTRPSDGTNTDRQAKKVMSDSGTEFGTTPDGEVTTPIRSNSAWAAQMNRMPMPTVRRFAKLLVIMGAVFATVLVAFAAFSMVLGHPYAGGRVLSTIAGLMILLGGYTIYKIVMINAFRFGAADDVALIKPSPRDGRLETRTDPGRPQTPE